MCCCCLSASYRVRITYHCRLQPRGARRRILALLALSSSLHIDVAAAEATMKLLYLFAKGSPSRLPMKIHIQLHLLPFAAASWLPEIQVCKRGLSSPTSLAISDKLTTKRLRIGCRSARTPSAIMIMSPLAPNQIEPTEYRVLRDLRSRHEDHAVRARARERPSHPSMTVTVLRTQQWWRYTLHS